MKALSCVKLSCKANLPMGHIWKSLCGQEAQHASYLGELWQGLTGRNDSLGHLQGEAGWTCGQDRGLPHYDRPIPPLCLISSHGRDFDYSAALMSMQTCCHLSDIALAWQLHSNCLQAPWNREAPVSCTSLKHIIATVQVSNSSLPLLNASLSSAFSSHFCVLCPHCQPLGRGCSPAASLGLPSREAPTLRTPTGGSPGCTWGCRGASLLPPYPPQGH